MNSSQKIKNGLYFTITPESTDRANNSFLKREKDHITLSCRFSKFDCRTADTDAPVSYDIKFVFNKNYLKGFSQQENFSLEQFPEFMDHDICCSTQMILYEIINCRLEGTFRNIFLESKALSLLLCFQKCYLTEHPDCANCKFLNKPVEKEKILNAKVFLLNNLDRPPTIPELSLRIGINQCYLKKGFKELFGSTVYDFIQEQRMMKAKFLLTTTNYTVSQVADTIGFSSVSNFSSAFKKFTGVFPSELQKN